MNRNYFNSIFVSLIFLLWCILVRNIDRIKNTIYTKKHSRYCIVLSAVAELGLDNRLLNDLDKLFISYPSEPFQQAVIWPTYTQPQTTLQAPHMLMPSLPASQLPPPPPPLAPFVLGADYLAASTTLHQVSILREKLSQANWFTIRSIHRLIAHGWWRWHLTRLRNARTMRAT